MKISDASYKMSRSAKIQLANAETKSAIRKALIDSETNQIKKPSKK